MPSLAPRPIRRGYRPQAGPAATLISRTTRLHGAPRMYYSAYDCAFVAELAAQIRGAAAKEV
jgi:uncharacterized protein YecE (DUF72 family)